MASRFKQNMQNFFSGRNGLDELGLVCFILSIIFSILNMFFPNLVIFYILDLIFVIYAFFRFFSRNVYKRELENERFTNFFKNIFKRGSKQRPIKVKPIKEKKVKVKKVKVKKEKEKKKDKNYLYHRCPHCNNIIKVSRKIKGEKLVMCMKCYNEISIKVK